MNLSKGASAIAQLAEMTGYTGEKTVYLGALDKTVIADRNRRLVYWNDGQVEGVAVLPANAGIPFRLADDFGAQNLRIKIAYPPNRTVYYVIEIDDVGMTSLRGLTPQDRALGVALLPKFNQLDTLRVMPTPSPSKAVQVSGNYLYIDGENAQQAFLGGALDVTATIASLTPGQHRLGIVCLDQATGELSLATSAAISAVNSVPSRGEFGIGEILSVPLTGSQRPLCPIYFYYAQNAIAEEDLYRTYNMPRFEGRASRFYQTLQNNGSSMNQRGRINFIAGSGVTLNIADDAGNNRTNVTIFSTVSGIVSVENGGTGLGALTDNALMVGNGTSAIELLSPTASGTFLRSNGTLWSGATISASDIASALSSPPAIGGGTRAAGTFSTLAAGTTSQFSVASTGVVSISATDAFGAVQLTGPTPGFYLIETGTPTLRNALFVLDGNLFQIQSRQSDGTYLTSNLALDVLNNVAGINNAAPNLYDATLSLVGLGDRIGLRVRSHSTHTKDYLLIETNAGGALVSVPSGGGLRLHANPASGASGTITLTNAVAGTPSNSATPTKWLTVYDATTARYIPLYT